jgi:hypothetical protein
VEDHARTALGAAIMLSIPILMISVTLLARPTLVRWLNIAMGIVQALIAAAQTVGAWAPRTYYYMYFGAVEFGLTYSSRGTPCDGCLRPNGQMTRTSHNARSACSPPTARFAWLSGSRRLLG